MTPCITEGKKIPTPVLTHTNIHHRSATILVRMGGWEHRRIGG